MKRNFIIYTIIVTMLFASCSGDIIPYEYFKQYEIDGDILSDIEELNALLLNSLITRDESQVVDLFTKSAFYDLDLPGERYLDYDIMETAEYENISYYYIKINDRNPSVSLNIPLEDEGYYFVKETQYKECIISVNKLSVEDFQYIITLFYVKEKGDWKVNYADAQYYSTYSITTESAYEKSVELSSEGNIEASLIYNDYIEHMLINYKYLQLGNSGEIRAHINTVQKSVELPLVSQIIEGVDVYRFYCYPRKDGIEVTIQYTTEINVINPNDNEIEALEKEAYSIHESLMYVYEDLGSEFTTFRYQACNEIPYSRVRNYDNYKTYFTR